MDAPPSGTTSSSGTTPLRPHRLTRTVPALAAAATLALTACGDQQADGAGSGGDTEASAELTIATSDFLGAAQFQLATADDAWEEHGVDADMQRFPSGREALDAVLGGTAEVAAVGDLPTVTAVLAEEEIQILGALSYGTNWRVLTTAEAGIEEPADLEGARVGVPQGTNAQYLLGLVLASADLTEEDVELVNLGPNQVPPSLETGEIDAGLTFPTFWSTAEQALGDDLSWFVFDEYQSATVLIARQEADDEALSRVAEALLASEELISEDAEAAQQAVSEGSGGEITAEQVAELWDNYDIGLTLGDDLVQTLADEAAWAVDELDISGDPSVENFMEFTNPAPLSAADPDAVTLTESN